MKLQPTTTPTITGPSSGGSVSLRPVFGTGPTGATGATGATGTQGPAGPGTGAGAWQATTAYTANQVVQAPDGSIIYRLSSGTSRSSFDGTEAALWGTVSSKSGTLENTALTASYARAPIWTPGAEYDRGQWVINPAGQVANVAKPHTADTAYDATKFGTRLKFGSHILDSLRRLSRPTTDDPFVIGCYGHSVVVGAYANDVSASDNATWRTAGWVARLRDMFGAAGEGMFYPDTSESASGVIGSLTGGAVVQSDTSTGYAGKRIYLPTGAAEFTLVAPKSTRISFLVLGDGFSSYGALRTSVDGGAYTTHTAETGDTYWAHVDGLTDATHTVTVKGAADDKPCYVVLVNCLRTPDEGVQVHRLGLSGMTAGDCFAWAGKSGTTLGGLSDANKDRQLRTVVTDVGVDLAVLMFNVNDTSRGYTVHGRTPTDVQVAVQTLCNKITASGTDVLLLCGPTKDPTSYSSPDTVAEYAQAYYNVAEATDGVAFLDIEQRWDDYTTSDAEGLSWDYVHPSSTGHLDIARTVHLALTNPVQPEVETITHAADTFTRSNTTGGPGLTETGAYTWSVKGSGSTVEVVSNEMKFTVIGTAPQDCTIDDGRPNGTIRGTVKIGGYVGGLVFRQDSTSANGYMFYNNGSNWSLRKRVAGTPSVLVTGAAVAAVAGDVMTVILDGPSITCRVHSSAGVLVTEVTYTDPTFQTQTAHGFYATTANHRLDDFSHTNAVA